MAGKAAVRIAGAALALGLALLGVLAWQEQLIARKTIGVGIVESDSGLVISRVDPGSPADRAGLQAGDVLMEVAGEAVPGLAELAAKSEDFSAGDAVPILVWRGDGLVAVNLEPGVSFPWLEFGLNALVALAYLALAVLALLRTPGGLAARLLFTFSFAVAVELLLPQRLAGQSGWLLIHDVLVYVLAGLQIAVELHLASVIPQPFTWFTRRPWLPVLFYCVGTAVAVLGCAAPIFEAMGIDRLPWSSVTALNVFYTWGFALWGTAVIAILVLQVRCSDTRILRSQALLVLMAVILWAVFELALNVVEWLGLSIPSLVDVVQPIILLAYPVAIFVAIFRFRLFDIEFVARRSVVFTILTTTFLVLFYGIFVTFSLTFAHRVEDRSFPAPLLAIVMLLLGLAFSPLHRRVRDLVGRRLFPDRLLMRQRLTELAAMLPTRGGLEGIGKELVRQLSEIFGLSSTTLLIADPGSGVLLTLASTAASAEAGLNHSVLIEVDDPAVRYLSTEGGILPAAAIAARSPALAQRIAVFDAAHVLALCSGDTPVGVLMLGKRTEDEGFQSEERELITLFSHTVATILENARLFASATYDGLTGVLRREAILSLLDVEIHRSARYGRPLTLAMVDIDHFKRVNDVHGHLAGDAILKSVANTLKTSVRSSDALGRYGGEEFLVFLPETAGEGGWQLAEKLRQTIESTRYSVPGVGDLQITVSIGVATIAPVTLEDTVENLISRADSELLTAKREGRNRISAALPLRSGSDESMP